MTLSRQAIVATYIDDVVSSHVPRLSHMKNETKPVIRLLIDLSRRSVGRQAVGPRTIAQYIPRLSGADFLQHSPRRHTKGSRCFPLRRPETKSAISETHMQYARLGRSVCIRHIFSASLVTVHSAQSENNETTSRARGGGGNNI